MNRLLFLSLFVAFAAYASGYGEGFRSIGFHSAYTKDFYELCPGDEFKYKDKLVNSFFTMRGDQETILIGDYALEDSVNYHRLFNSSHADQLEAIRKNYHDRLIEMWGKDYLNNPSYKENVMLEKLNRLHTNLTSFKGKGKNPFLGDTILGMQSRQIDAARNFSSVLHTFKTAKNPTPDETVLRIFEKQLKYTMMAIGDKNTTMVLWEEDTVDIFTKDIYQFNHWEAIKSSKILYNWRKDYGKVHFDMHLPFAQNGSKWVNKTRPCVPAKKLPEFYRLKGKVNH